MDISIKDYSMITVIVANPLLLSFINKLIYIDI